MLILNSAFFFLIESKILAINYFLFLSSRAQRDPKIHQCKVCWRYHSLRFCKKFLQMKAAERKHVVDKHNYCSNCLARSHTLRRCTSQVTCRNCGESHHTLLHYALHPRTKSQPTKTHPNTHRQTKAGCTKLKGNRKLPSQPNQRSSNQIQLIPSDQQQIITTAIKSLANLLV